MAYADPYSEEELDAFRKKAEEEKKSIEESMKLTKNTEIEWGSQIRSYVLHPYKMVKDHETGHESGNPDAVLAGDLDDFIDAPLPDGVQ